MSQCVSDWLVAYNRFGLGAPAGGAGTRAAVLSELETPDVAGLADAGLQSSKAVLQAIYDYQSRKKTAVERMAARRADPQPAPASSAAPSAKPAQSQAGAEPTPNGMVVAMDAAEMAGANGMAAEKPPEGAMYRAEALARVRKAQAAAVGYVERLVAFWSNHFCVSALKNGIGRGCAGPFEREAIRPHVLGRFADMLKAVERHPAMLNYLDNARSIGPDSAVGQNRGVGLNENLAREILELHTLGVGSGYRQADVTQFARALTGWTIAGHDGKLGEPGTFIFNDRAHEPGSAEILGRVYAQAGVAQGEAVLADLARAPATADHLARKLVKHFIADEPDAALVGRMAKTFRATDGDLLAVSKALIEDDAAWGAPLAKIRNPWELATAANRAFARSPDDAGQTLDALSLLGMPLWQPPGPNGFSDDSGAWASPEGMKMRLALAPRLARAQKDTPAPLDLLDQVLGPLASAETRQALARAETREQAYALLVMSPEFQRR